MSSLADASDVKLNGFSVQSIYRSGVKLWPAPPIVATDPLAANVTSLLRFQGINGAASVIDEKGLTWSIAGGAVLTNANPMFGETSLNMPNGNSLISTLDTEAFHFADADWTVELYCRTSVSRAAYLSMIWSRLASNFEWELYFNPGTTGVEYYDAESYLPKGDALTATGATMLFEVCRSGNVLRVFMDGVLIGKAGAITKTFAKPDVFGVGSEGAFGGPSFVGQLGAMRTTKAARHTSDTTYVPAPFLAI